MKYAYLFLLFFILAHSPKVQSKHPHTQEEVLDLQLDISSKFLEIIEREHQFGWKEFPMRGQNAICRLIAYKINLENFEKPTKKFDFKTILENQPNSTEGQNCLGAIADLLYKKFKKVVLFSEDQKDLQLFSPAKQDLLFKRNFQKNGGKSIKDDLSSALSEIKEQKAAAVTRKATTKTSHEVQLCVKKFEREARLLLTINKLEELKVLILGFQYILSEARRFDISQLTSGLISGLAFYQSTVSTIDPYSNIYVEIANILKKYSSDIFGVTELANYLITMSHKTLSYYHLMNSSWIPKLKSLHNIFAQSKGLSVLLRCLSCINPEEINKSSIDQLIDYALNSEFTLKKVIKKLRLSTSNNPPIEPMIKKLEIVFNGTLKQ